MKVNNDIINIDMMQLLEWLSDDAKLQMVKHLACEDVIIERVAQSIAHGQTDDGWYGSYRDDARKLISEEMGNIEQAVHDDYKHQIKMLTEQCESYRIMAQDAHNRRR